MKKFLSVLCALMLTFAVASCDSPSADLETSGETSAPTTHSHADSRSDGTAVDTAPAVPKAPDFSVINANGESVKLSDFEGKPVIVNFWATWCGPCKRELPDFEEKYQAYGDSIQFLMVDLADGKQETVEGAKDFVSAQGYTFPVYFDTESSAANAYGVSSIPMTVFINAQGEIVTYAVGMLNAATLQKGIDLLLSAD